MCKALTPDEGKVALDGLIEVMGRLKKESDSGQGVLELAINEGLTHYGAL